MTSKKMTIFIAVLALTTAIAIWLALPPSGLPPQPAAVSTHEVATDPRSAPTARPSGQAMAPSLAAAAAAQTPAELAAAAALGQAEARAAANVGSPDVNKYGVTAAEVAAARAKSLQWMTEHCDAASKTCNMK